MPQGFTLTELAVVLVIVALLLGGLLLPLSAQIELRNINDNRKAMAEIREALLGYAAVHGRLPCAAKPDLASQASGAGVEMTQGAGGPCDPSVLAGVLPWVTLGVSENDAWGRRYSYRVSSTFARNVPPPNDAVSGCGPAPPIPANAAFALCANGDISIRSAKGGVLVADEVPAVIISHGNNGHGAYTAEGTRLPAGADADELENQVLRNLASVWTDLPNQKEFVRRTAPTATYDDEVVWIPPGLLFNRMITAGKLP